MTQMKPIVFDAGTAWVCRPTDQTQPLPVVYLQDGEEFAAAAPAALDALPETQKLVLVGVTPARRDAAYTPWPAPAVFRDSPPFAGEMEAFLPALLALKTQVDSQYSTLPGPASTGVAGLSLGGLLALWALAKSDAFGCAASISGSLWYEGFVDFLQANPPQAPGASVYLSLGDREGKSRNPVLRSVEEQHRRAADFYADRLGAGQVSYTLTPGGHTTDLPGRLAQALEWMAARLAR